MDFGQKLFTCVVIGLSPPVARLNMHYKLAANNLEMPWLDECSLICLPT